MIATREQYRCNLKRQKVVLVQDRPHPLAVPLDRRLNNTGRKHERPLTVDDDVAELDDKNGGCDQRHLPLPVVRAFEDGPVRGYEHDHEDKQHEDPAYVHDDLYAGQKLGPKAQEHTRHRQQRTGEKHRAVHGVLPGDDEDRRNDRGRCEDVEDDEFQHQLLSKSLRVEDGLIPFFQFLPIPLHVLAPVQRQLEILRQLQARRRTRVLAETAEHAPRKVKRERCQHLLSLVGAIPAQPRCNTPDRPAHTGYRRCTA